MALLLGILTTTAHAGVVIVCNPALPVADKIDKTTLARIFTGRAVQIDGINVLPVNLTAANGERRIFVHQILQQSDDEYVAYWLVRKSIGKGTPPQEFLTAKEVVQYIRTNPGAIGYIDEQQIEPGIRILLKIQ